MTATFESQVRSAMTAAVRDVQLPAGFAERIITTPKSPQLSYRARFAVTVAAVLCLASAGVLLGGEVPGRSPDQAWAASIASVTPQPSDKKVSLLDVSGLSVTFLPDDVRAPVGGMSFIGSAGPGYSLTSQLISGNGQAPPQGAERPPGERSLTVSVLRGPKADLSHIRATMFMGATEDTSLAGAPAVRSVIKSDGGAKHLYWQIAPGVVAHVGALGLDNEEVVAVAAGMRPASDQVAGAGQP